MTERPTGTVTFLFTDIEQSTKRWEEHPDAMRVALTRHDTTLKQGIESTGVRRMLEESRGSSDIMFFGPGFGGLVVLFDRLGLLQVAATLYGALVLKVETEGFIDELPQAIQHVRSALGNAEVEKLSQRGATMTVHEATDYAEEQIRLALAAAGASDV